MPATEKPRGSNYTPPTGTKSIQGVVNVMAATKTAGGLAALNDLAERFMKRRQGIKYWSLDRHETRILDQVEAAVATAKAWDLAPDAPLDSKFWARVNHLADACWEGDIRTRAVEHVLQDEALDSTTGQA